MYILYSLPYYFTLVDRSSPFMMLAVMVPFYAFCLFLLFSASSVEGVPSHFKRSHNGPRHAPGDYRENHAVHVRQENGSSPTITVPVNGSSNGTYSRPAGCRKPTTISNAPITVTLATQVESQSPQAAATTPVVPVMMAEAQQVKVQTIQAAATPAVAPAAGPAYSVCAISGDCTTLQQAPVQGAAATSGCSTVLTGFFEKVTVTDCAQSVTFSTSNSYALVTPTPTAAATNQVQRRDVVSTTMSIQSIVSYYVANWRSLAANDPSEITVKVCTLDGTTTKNCNTLQEIWAVRTVFVPATATTTITVSQTLATVSISCKEVRSC